MKLVFSVLSNDSIYFPGIIEMPRTLFQYSLPKSCTIFLVVKMLDEKGLISHVKNNVVIFNLNDVRYYYLDSLVQKNLELRKKYSIILKIKNKILIDVIITNDESRSKASWSPKHFIFDKIMIGYGKGILYDLIVYENILSSEEIKQKTKILNNFHKPYF